MDPFINFSANPAYNITDIQLIIWICFKEKGMTGTSRKFLNHSSRTKDVMHDPTHDLNVCMISTYCNLNISKHIYEYVLNAYLKRMRNGSNTSDSNICPVEISDLNAGYMEARQIIFGLIEHCHVRREFNWSDFINCFKLGRFLYNILTLICNDVGYKSFFTYNLTLFHSFMNKFNPLTYKVLNCSPLYPGPCIPGALAWSFFFLCKPSFLRFRERLELFSNAEYQELLEQSFRQNWKNFSCDKMIPLTKTMKFCKAIFLIYCLQRYYRCVQFGKEPSPPLPSVIPNPYILLINV